MGTKMKGLLKGLRYISQIFEGEDKEPEMEIGFPTDVKHVAHIGWDGPSMTEYKSAPLTATNGEGAEVEPPKFPSAEFQPTGEPPRPRQSRQKDSSSSDQPARDSSKPSRRRPSSGAITVDVPPREPSEGSRRGRRTQSSNTGGGSSGPDSPTSTQQDSSGIPKQSRRRKTKGSNSGGSSRSSRTKSVENGPDDRSTVEPSPSSKPEREEEEEGCLV